MQKHVNLVDLVKSFPTNIFLQNLASIQKRTSPLKFAHLAEKSGNGSISNLSTKSCTALRGAVGFSSAVGFIAEAPDAELPMEMHFYDSVTRRVPEAVEPAKATDAKGTVITTAEETGDAAEREGSDCERSDR